MNPAHIRRSVVVMAAAGTTLVVALLLGFYLSQSGSRPLIANLQRMAGKPKTIAPKPTQTQPLRLPSPTVLAATSTAPAPTVRAVNPTPPRPTLALVDCNVYGGVYHVTFEQCISSQVNEREFEAQRQKELGSSQFKMDMHLDSPPTLIPINATPTPATCDYAAKAALDAKYQTDSSNLYRDYQNALSQISAAGAVNSSAVQMAQAAYSSGQSRLDSAYAFQVAALHCG